MLDWPLIYESIQTYKIEATLKVADLRKTFVWPAHYDIPGTQASFVPQYYYSSDLCCVYLRVVNGYCKAGEQCVSVLPSNALLHVQW